MRGLTLTTTLLFSAVLTAAPVPSEPAAKTLVAGLSDPSEAVRDQSSRDLRNRPDALPWLRRAARSADRDAARRANELAGPPTLDRLKGAGQMLDVCLRTGHLDLVAEWHHMWLPEQTDELWAVGPRVSQPGMDLFARERGPKITKLVNHLMGFVEGKLRTHDGPWESWELRDTTDTWNIRTDRCDACPAFVSFASTAGPTRLLHTPRGRFLTLGPVYGHTVEKMFLACDGDVWHRSGRDDKPVGVTTGLCVVVCRGTYYAHNVGSSVVLVDGDIDLSSSVVHVQDSLLRATGEIRLHKECKPVDSKIEPHTKNATAPYKFFELADVGVSLADDEEGLVVTAVKAGTPFGDCGLAKGDLIRAIDDAPAGHSEEFRKKVRRALVRQGDCLLTVARGDKTIDLPVFFPLPK